jgi:hypothetical protein
VRGAYPQLEDAASPVMLVVVLRHDDLGSAGVRGRGRGARATVVHDRGDPGEQRLLVDLADGETVGCLVHERQVGPAARHDRPHP